MHAAPEDLPRVPGIIAGYQKGGYADGSRSARRNGVLYAWPWTDWPTVLVWGGPEHIRVSFGREP